MADPPVVPLDVDRSGAVGRGGAWEGFPVFRCFTNLDGAASFHGKVLLLKLGSLASR